MGLRRLTNHIFKTREAIKLHDFSTLQHRFVVNTSVDSNSIFINFITQMAPPGESQRPGFRFQRLLLEFQHKMLSRSSLARFLNKIANSSVSKDRKIASVHGLLNQLQTFCLLETWYMQRGVAKVTQVPARRQLMMTSSLQQNDGHIKLSLSERMMFV